MYFEMGMVKGFVVLKIFVYIETLWVFTVCTCVDFYMSKQQYLVIRFKTLCFADIFQRKGFLKNVMQLGGYCHMWKIRTPGRSHTKYTSYIHYQELNK